MSSVTAVPILPLARGSILKLWIGVAVLAAGGAALAWVGTQPVQRETTPGGLQYQVVEAGEGPGITSSDLVQFHVIGRREDGTIFFSSLGREPLTGSTTQSPIPTIGEGLAMMRPGSHYRFWVPASRAFPEPPPAEARIAPDDKINFDVQVLNVLPGMAAMQQMGLPGMGGAPGGDPHAGLPPEAGAPPPPGAEAGPTEAAPPAPVGNAQ